MPHILWEAFSVVLVVSITIVVTNWRNTRIEAERRREYAKKATKTTILEKSENIA